MRRHRLATLSAATLVATAAAVFGAPTGADARDEPVTHDDYDPARFDEDAPEIENRWTPFEPGMKFVLEGTADRGDGPTTHRVTLIVTDLVKVVDGVPTRVLYDVDESDGVLSEAELAFWAQDEDDNVWLMGEYPEEFVDGQFEGAPSTWIGGVEDAQPGVMMRRKPRAGQSDYFQAIIESIEFADIAHIVGKEKQVCVKVGCYSNVLVIRETNTFVPDEGFQLKYYAPRVGNIRVDFVGGAEQETLELVERRKLSDSERAAANAAALELDERAYENAGEIYGDTPPAERELDD